MTGGNCPAVPRAAGSGWPLGFRRSRGFTLVELLVVVSIIALLISILLPSLRNARDQAKAIKCLGHMRGVGQSAMVFANDHNNRMQLVASPGNTDAADPTRQLYAYGSGGELLCWPTALAQVTSSDYRENWDWGVRASSYADAKANDNHIDKDMDVYVCPGDRVVLSSSFFPRNESLYGNGLRGPGDPNNPISPANRMAYWGRLSYGVNEDITGGDGTLPDLWPSCWRAVRETTGWIECDGGVLYGPRSACFRSTGSRLRGEIDKVFAPSKVGLFFETGPESVEAAQDPVGSLHYANMINSTARTESQQAKDLAGPYLGDAQQSHPWRIPTTRHPDGRVNVTFADGHGEGVRASRYAFNEEVDRELPSAYAPRVRVSPFNPHGVGGN